MNLLILINFLIFSVVFSLFSIEFGIAMLFLTNYKRYKKQILDYISPIWEITGTFAVFYLVNLVATFPGLIPTIGILYVAPAVLIAILLIVRDSFLAYSEFLGAKYERKYLTAYSILTIIVIFLFISVITSAISGNGVNQALTSINLPSFLINPLNLAAFAILAFVIYGLTIFMFNIKYAKTFVLPSLFVVFFISEVLFYPYLFNHTLNINNYVAIPPASTFILYLTLGGGLFLTIALGYFLYVQKLKKSRPLKPY